MNPFRTPPWDLQSLEAAERERLRREWYSLQILCAMIDDGWASIDDNGKRTLGKGSMSEIAARLAKELMENSK